MSVYMDISYFATSPQTPSEKPTLEGGDAKFSERLVLSNCFKPLPFNFKKMKVNKSKRHTDFKRDRSLNNSVLFKQIFKDDKFSPLEDAHFISWTPSDEVAVPSRLPSFSRKYLREHAKILDAVTQFNNVKTVDLGSVFSKVDSRQLSNKVGAAIRYLPSRDVSVVNVVEFTKEPESLRKRKNALQKRNFRFDLQGNYSDTISLDNPIWVSRNAENVQIVNIKCFDTEHFSVSRNGRFSQLQIVPKGKFMGNHASTLNEENMMESKSKAAQDVCDVESSQQATPIEIESQKLVLENSVICKVWRPWEVESTDSQTSGYSGCTFTEHSRPCANKYCDARNEKALMSLEDDSVNELSPRKFALLKTVEDEYLSTDLGEQQNASEETFLMTRYFDSIPSVPTSIRDDIINSIIEDQVLDVTEDHYDPEVHLEIEERLLQQLTFQTTRIVEENGPILAESVNTLDYSPPIISQQKEGDGFLLVKKKQKANKKNKIKAVKKETQAVRDAKKLAARNDPILVQNRINGVVHGATFDSNKVSDAAGFLDVAARNAKQDPTTKSVAPTPKPKSFKLSDEELKAIPWKIRKDVEKGLNWPQKPADRSDKQANAIFYREQARVLETRDKQLKEWLDAHPLTKKSSVKKVKPDKPIVYANKLWAGSTLLGRTQGWYVTKSINDTVHNPLVTHVDSKAYISMSYVVPTYVPSFEWALADNSPYKGKPLVENVNDLYKKDRVNNN